MTGTTTKEFTVGGMSCGGCVQSVTKAIARLPGVRNVDVSLEKKAATSNTTTRPSSPPRSSPRSRRRGSRPQAATSPSWAAAP